MFNKKGGAAIDELRGVLTYTFVFVIMLLFFYGCSIFNEKIDEQTLSISKDKILANKNLNTFLETPVVEGKNFADLIIGSYLSNDYNEFENKAKEYFTGLDLYCRVQVYSKDDRLQYEYKLLAPNQNTIDDPIQGHIMLPIPDGNSQILTIILQIKEKTD